MNMFAFTSTELDLIYDVIFERLACTDDDNMLRDGHSIIDKMHIHCTMNQDEV